MDANRPFFVYVYTNINIYEKDLHYIHNQYILVCTYNHVFIVLLIAVYANECVVYSSSLQPVPPQLVLVYLLLRSSRYTILVYEKKKKKVDAGVSPVPLLLLAAIGCGAVLLLCCGAPAFPNRERANG